MSRETGEPVTHFPGPLGWSPRAVNCGTACGQIVAQIRTSQKVEEVDCPRCGATRRYQAAVVQRARGSALFRALLRAGADFGMKR